MYCLALVACGDVSNRYAYFPVTTDEEATVRGCDGYALGTVRVDRSNGTATTCIPLRSACNDTRDAGCGEERFGTSVSEVRAGN